MMVDGRGRVKLSRFCWQVDERPSRRRSPRVCSSAPCTGWALHYMSPSRCGRSRRALDSSRSASCSTRSDRPLPFEGATAPTSRPHPFRIHRPFPTNYAGPELLDASADALARRAFRSIGAELYIDLPHARGSTTRASRSPPLAPSGRHLVNDRRSPADDRRLSRCDFGKPLDPSTMVRPVIARPSPPTCAPARRTIIGAPMSTTPSST